MNIDLESYIVIIGEYTIKYGMKILGAVVVLIAGLLVIKVVNKSVARVIINRKIDASLQPFLKSLISALLKVLLIITVMSMVGIEMTSFVAILGAAGLAIGLALSGTLQNFAGGVMILMLKPFKVGDFIEAQGFTGEVREIQIFHTIINTVDNKRIIIPNNGLASNSIINYSAEEKRRVDFSFGIAYGEDVEKAKKIITDILMADERVHKDPLPFVRIGELADSSVNLTTRAWVNTTDYWAVSFDTREKVYEAFLTSGINIPFPQMDVHLYKKN